MDGPCSYEAPHPQQTVRHTFGPTQVPRDIPEGHELYVETFTYPNGLTTCYFATRAERHESWGPPIALSQGS